MEKALSEPPPPSYTSVQYIPPNENAPLLAGQQQVYVVQKSSSSSMRCGMSLSVCIFLSVSCFCCLAILAGIFGAWAVRCSTISLYRTESHEILFNGTDAKTVDISVAGSITLNPVVSNAYSVSTITKISAPDESSADELRVDFTGTNTEFLLEVPWTFWLCPEVEVSANMVDLPYLEGLTLNLQSASGDISVGNFPITQFNALDITTYNGQITCGVLLVQGDVDMFTSNSDISVTGIVGDDINLKTSNGDISLTALTGRSIDISTTYGQIDSTAIILSFLPPTSSGPCRMEIYSSYGHVSFDSLLFPLNVVCTVKIQTSNGDVYVSAQQFSGNYELQTSHGDVTVNGQECSRNACSGTISGPISHYLQIRTSNGGITLITS